MKKHKQIGKEYYSSLRTSYTYVYNARLSSNLLNNIWLYIESQEEYENRMDGKLQLGLENYIFSGSNLNMTP